MSDDPTTDARLADLAKQLPVAAPDDARRESVRASLLQAVRDDHSAPRRSWGLAGLGFAAGALAAAAVTILLVRAPASPPSSPPAHGAYATVESSSAVALEHVITPTPTGTLETVRVRGGSLRLAVPAVRPGDRVQLATRDAQVEGAGAFDVEVINDSLRSITVTRGSARVVVSGQAPVFLAAGQTWRAPIETADLTPPPDGNDKGTVPTVALADLQTATDPDAGSAASENRTSPGADTGTVPDTGAGNGTVPGAGNGTVPGAGNGTVPGAGNGTVPGAGNGTVPGAGKGTVPGARVTSTGKGTVPNSGAGKRTDPGAGVTSTDKGTVPNTGAEKGTVPNSGAENGTVPTTRAEKGTVPGARVTGAEKGTVPNSGAENGTAPTTGAEKGTVPGARMTGAEKGTVPDTSAGKGTVPGARVASKEKGTVPNSSVGNGTVPSAPAVEKGTVPNSGVGNGTVPSAPAVEKGTVPNSSGAGGTNAGRPAGSDTGVAKPGSSAVDREAADIVEGHFKAGVKLLRAKKYAEAAKELGTAAAGEGPLAADALYFQAQALIKIARGTEAERALVAFLDRSPASPRRGRAVVMLARLLAQRGEMASARSWYESVAEDKDPAVKAAAKQGLEELAK